MDEKMMFECGICYFQLKARDFAPLTVSADFSALKCPKCQNNVAETFQEIEKEKVAKAA